MKTVDGSADLISIGKLAQETGIHTSTLRVWEARYQVISPVRTAGGARRYTQEDVQRLKWIKALADMGHKPRLLAQLSLEELKAEFAQAPGGSAAGTGIDYTLRLGSLGDAVWAKAFFSHPALSEWPDVRHTDDLALLTEVGEPLDIVVIFTRALQASLAKALSTFVDENPRKTVIVVYEFSSALALNPLRQRDITCLKHPIDQEDFMSKLKSALIARSGRDATKKFIFSPSSLQSIISSEHRIMCECPRHLASLLVSLHGFIDYSNHCSEDSPRDALVHKKLRDIAQRSISQLETGLKLALESELDAK